MNRKTLRYFVLPLMVLLLQSCRADRPRFLDTHTPITVGILDVRFKDGAEKFRDKLAKRLDLINATPDGRRLRFVIEHTPFVGGIDAAARRLVAQSPDILLAVVDDAALALGAITKTIPIVFQSYDDPVAKGIVRSMTAPDANLTGHSFYRRTHLKRWELLLQAAPHVRRIGVLLDANYVPVGILEDMEKAKTGLGVDILPLYLTSDEPFAGLERKLRISGVDALDLPHIGHLTMNQRKTVAEIVKLNKPASFDGDLYCSWGGTICYARQNTPLENLAADYIKLVMRGARPSEIPVSSVSKYQLSLNITSMKRLRLQPPHALISTARIYE